MYCVTFHSWQTFESQRRIPLCNCANTDSVCLHRFWNFNLKIASAYERVKEIGKHTTGQRATILLFSKAQFVAGDIRWHRQRRHFTISTIGLYVRHCLCQPQKRRLMRPVWEWAATHDISSEQSAEFIGTETGVCNVDNVPTVYFMGESSAATCLPSGGAFFKDLNDRKIFTTTSSPLRPLRALPQQYFQFTPSGADSTRSWLPETN